MSEVSTKPSEPAIGQRKPLNGRLIGGLILPAFFALVFPFAFASATHAPAPHDLALTVVGPAQIVSDVAASLDETSKFAVSQTDVASEAANSVKERRADGAIEITATQQQAGAETSSDTSSPHPSITVTTYVANAGGRSQAAAVTAVGEAIAKQFGTTSAIKDVAPLADEDGLGTNLFYLLVYTSLAGYMVVIASATILPGAGIGTKYGIVAVAALFAPLLVFALSSIFVGDYGASFGTITAVLGVAALSVLVVGAVAILLQQFLGWQVQFGVMSAIVFLNFPSSGAIAANSMLPPFWQSMHSVWFGSAAFESFRSLVYFSGNGLGRWLLQLAAWLVIVVLLTIVVQLSRTVRQRRETRSPALQAAEEPEILHPADDDGSRAMAAETSTPVLTR